MTHPCIESVTKTINTLRTTSVTGPIEVGEKFTPHVYFGADCDGGNVTTTFHPLTAGLFKADLSVSGAPEWLTFNIELEQGSFSVGDTLGIIADLEGSDTFDVVPFIRSGLDDYNCDTYLSEPVKFGGKHSPSTTLHAFTASDPIVYGKGFHTLVFPLPHRDLAIQIHDLRVFVTRTVKLHATLGGIAV